MIPYNLEEVSRHFRYPAVRNCVKVVHVHLTTWHHNPRDSPLHTYCRANLKSHHIGKLVYIRTRDELKGDEMCTAPRLLVIGQISTGKLNHHVISKSPHIHWSTSHRVKLMEPTARTVFSCVYSCVQVDCKFKYLSSPVGKHHQLQ